jgi:hypothetical protein
MIPAREVIAQLRSVVERWHQIDPVLDWEAVEPLFPVNTSRWEGQVARLGLVNCYQWHLEDACRLSYCDLPQLGRLKLAIDQSNQRRVRSIGAIDRHVARDVSSLQTANNRATAACLVTPGDVIDRLSILELKRYHLAVPTAVAEQIADLCDGFDALVKALASGLQRFSFHSTEKTYGGHE